MRQDGVFSSPKQEIVRVSRPFQKAIDFAHHLFGRVRDTPNAIWGQVISTSLSRSLGQTARRRGAMIPSRRDQRARSAPAACRCAARSADRRPGDRRPIRTAARHFARGSPENGEPSVTTARTRSGYSAPDPARTRRPGSSRRSGSAARARSPRSAPSVGRPCRPRPPGSSPLPTVHPPAVRGERAAQFRGRPVVAMKPGMTSAGGPSSGPRGPRCPKPYTALGNGKPLGQASPTGERRSRG